MGLVRARTSTRKNVQLGKADKSQVILPSRSLTVEPAVVVVPFASAKQRWQHTEFTDVHLRKETIAYATHSTLCQGQPTAKSKHRTALRRLYHTVKLWEREAAVRGIVLV